MTNSDNMNLRGKRRVLVLLDVQQDYYKHTAEDKRRAADRDYTLPGVKSRVIEWLDEHEMDEVREVFGGSLKGYEYIIADEEGRFNSHALKESVGKFVSSWERDRTAKLDGSGKKKASANQKPVDDIEDIVDGIPEALQSLLGFAILGLIAYLIFS